MQELIEQLEVQHRKYIGNKSQDSWFRNVAYGLEIGLEIAERYAKQMLEKEREVMCDFQNKANFYDYWEKYNGSEDCFDKTFKTGEL